MGEVTRHLDQRSAGALRASCAPVRRALDATLERLAPRRGGPLGELGGLLQRLPALRELSLSACGDSALGDLGAMSEAEAALSPLCDILTRRLPHLASLELPVGPLLQLGSLEWARAMACAIDLPAADARAALKAVTARRYEGAYRSLERDPHAVLLVPARMVGPGVRRLVVTRSEGSTPAWPDNQPTCVWTDPEQLTQLQALHLEHVCLVHVPPPALRLAQAPGSALRQLRLHCCQIQSLPDDVIAPLTGITSLQLSGNFLKALPDSLGSLSALRELDVARNSLRTLCNGLGALSGLESLDVSSNQLLALPRCLGRLSGLRRLLLSHNWLSGAEGLAEACEAWGHLTELRLANVSDKNGALAVPASALASCCPCLELLDLTSQFHLDYSSLGGLSACGHLRRLELGWPPRDEARRLQEQLPGLVVA